MVASGYFLTVILASGLTSMKTCAAGSSQPCPTSAVVDLTDERPDGSGSVEKSGFFFPRGTTWLENGRKFGCKCGFHLCLAMCCLSGFASDAKGCGEVNLTGLIPRMYRSDGDNSRRYDAKYDRSLHLFTDHRCDLNSPHHYTLRFLNYEILQSGAIYQTDIKRIHEMGNYCLFPEEDPSFYSAKICNLPGETSIDPWVVVSLNVSALFALATFIVHTVMPGGKSLQEFTLRSFLAAYILCILTVEICMIQQSSPSTDFVIIGFFGFHYFLNASGLWLNVMSFDVWHNFRKFALTIRDGDDIENDRKAKFVCYSIYAWGGAAAIVFILFIFFFADVGKTSSSVSICLTMGPPIVIAICNLFLYVLIAIKIRQQKRETTDLITDTEKTYEEEIQRFTSSLKLFIIMASPLILIVVAIFWDNSVFSWIVSTVQALQGIPIFLTLGWTDKVKKSFVERFCGARRTRLDFFRRRDSTPARNSSTKFLP